MNKSAEPFKPNIPWIDRDGWHQIVLGLLVAATIVGGPALIGIAISYLIGS